MSEVVYCNRTLNLKRIKYIGFDMDHTLVRYDIEKFEHLVHEETLRKLQDLRDYPKSVGEIPFEPTRVIRGLVVDQRNGNVLKLNLHGAIRQSYHGTKPIDYRKQRKIYRGTMVDLGDKNFLAIDTAFSIAYLNIFMHLVDMKDRDLDLDLPSYEQISQDVLDCVDLCHRDGSVKDIVAQDLEKYIINDPEMVASLERYLKHGKKLFVLTNSDYNYTKKLLDYSINPFLKEAKHWSEIFEFVITLAAKPRFFYDSLNFMKVDPDTGLMSNHDGPVTPGIYQGGCALKFTNDMKLDGEDILYVGDHIYGDIVRLKKDCNWRTALVVEELREEVEKNIEAKPIFQQIWKLMEDKTPLEAELQNLEDQKREKGKKDLPEERMDSLLREINDVDKQISNLIGEHQSVYNQYWGEVMRTGNEESYFAAQVMRYACVYTANLGDLLSNSPRTYYRSPRNRLPHEQV
ncbi:MAG: HAD-IG family 5'-nucleotidase [Bdellovibrionota bacterium]|nr:HAD-IG family 5'-nucleotidase [Bdellovibrionota bacterium]